MEHRQHTALVGILIMIICEWFNAVTATTSSFLDDRSSFQRNVVLEDSRWMLDQDILWEQLTHHCPPNQNPVNWWEGSIWLATYH